MLQKNKQEMYTTKTKEFKVQYELQSTDFCSYSLDEASSHIVVMSVGPLSNNRFYVTNYFVTKYVIHCMVISNNKRPWLFQKNVQLHLITVLYEKTKTFFTYNTESI